MNENLKKARSEREKMMRMRNIEVNIRNAGYDIPETRLFQAVDYLTGAKLIKQTKESSVINTRRVGSFGRNNIPSSGIKHVTYYYSLTNKAIDELDGETEYSSKPFIPLQNVTITATNSAVVIGSDNNVTTHADIYEQLDLLRKELLDAEKLSIEERQDAVGDLESIKQQLAKTNPNKSVIKVLWQTVGRAADIAGASQLAITAAKLIAAAIGHPIN